MRRTWMICAAAAALAACSRPPPAPAPATGEGAPEADYARPPQVRAAAAAAGGAAILSGVAQPDALVRLAAPDGSALGAGASHAGEWTVTLPASVEPRLLSLSEDVAGRPLRALGYVAVLPAPVVAAAILRPGAAAVPIRRDHGLAITALDFDAAGAAIVSGLARPNATVQVAVDGAYAGEDRADAAGRFSVSLPQALRPGSHAVAARSGEARAEVALQAAAPRAPMRTIYVSARSGKAWRIDWVTPGGGVQSTLLFDPAGDRS